MILAAVDWQSVGVVLGVTVSALSAILVYVKGRKSDDALQSASMVQTAFTGTQSLVEALQEEVQRHSDSTQKCLKECDALRQALTTALTDLSEARLEIKNLKADLARYMRSGVKNE